MADYTDILLTSDYDLSVKDGDFETGAVVRQVQNLLMATSKGDWKQHPLLGVGIYEYLKSENLNVMVAEIKRQFKSEGLQINLIEINSDKIIIDANY